MSVQSTDLRIGNWIWRSTLDPSGDIGFQQVTATLLVAMAQIEYVYAEPIVDPIRIDPDILTGSGFDARDASDEGYIGLTFTLIHMVNGKQDYFTLVKNGDGDEYEFEFYYDESSKIRPHRLIRYVHELQNLYFALYREELSIIL